MALSNLSAPPLQSDLIESAQIRQMTSVWYHWLLSVLTRVQKSAWIRGTVALTAQVASIGLTSLIPLADAGVYRVSIAARITTPGTVSSSLIVSVVSTQGGVTVTQATAAQTGNTTASVVSQVFLVRSDGTVPLSYTTTYASAGATPMQYTLDIITEQIG